ncbi:DDRGK protein, partial [Atractosteus spatula]|nr:DDRGK protein [Atractosteus spatula]
MLEMDVVLYAVAAAILAVLIVFAVKVRGQAEQGELCGGAGAAGAAAGRADRDHRQDVQARARPPVVEDRPAGVPRRRRNLNARVTAQRRAQRDAPDLEDSDGEEQDPEERPQLPGAEKVGAKKQRKLEEKQARRAQREPLLGSPGGPVGLCSPLADVRPCPDPSSCSRLTQDAQPPLGEPSLSSLAVLLRLLSYRTVASGAELEDREERKRTQQLREEERRREEERERLEEQRKAEEEQRTREEQERREHEEYLKLKETFTVEEQGLTDTLTEQETHSLLQEFIEYIKNAKVVLLEDLASHFGMRTQDAISRLQDLIADGSLTGVIDDRGKFIYITPAELSAVARFIKQRGRVSIAELAQASNSLIRLAPETPLTA